MNGDTAIVIIGSNGDRVFIFNTDFPITVDLGWCGDCFSHAVFRNWIDVEKTHKVTGVLLENRDKIK